MNNIERERISMKDAKALISGFYGKLDQVSLPDYDHEIYVLSDGRVVVPFETFAYSYKGIDDLKKWVSGLRQKQRSRPVSHILDGKLLYGKDFASNAGRLAQRVVDDFHLKGGDFLENLKQIDELLRRRDSNRVIDDTLFSSLVAFVGEAMKEQFGGGDWIMKKVNAFDEIWEPYISFQGSVYNPFFPVYKELYEELPESGEINLYESVFRELNK